MSDNTTTTTPPGPQHQQETTKAPASQRKTVREAFLNGASSPMGTKRSAGSLPTVFLPVPKNRVR